MKIHRHKWKKTGGANYTCPLQFEFKCQCGAVKWVEEDIGIPTKILTDIEKKILRVVICGGKKISR